MQSYSARSQKWTLDKLGNWTNVASDPNASGVYQAQEERDHEGDGAHAAGVTVAGRRLEEYQKHRKPMSKA